MIDKAVAMSERNIPVKDLSLWNNRAIFSVTIFTLFFGANIGRNTISNDSSSLKS